MAPSPSLLVLTMALLCLQASAFDSLSAPTANSMIDDFLDRIGAKMDEKFEPIVLPDAGFQFEKKILMVTVKGGSKLC